MTILRLLALAMLTLNCGCGLLELNSALNNRPVRRYDSSEYRFTKLRCARCDGAGFSGLVSCHLCGGSGRR